MFTQNKCQNLLDKKGLHNLHLWPSQFCLTRNYYHVSFFTVSLTPSLKSMFLNNDLEKRTTMVQHKQIWTSNRVSIFDLTLCTRFEQEVPVTFKVYHFKPTNVFRFLQHLQLLRHPHRQHDKQKTLFHPSVSFLKTEFSGNWALFMKDTFE